MYATGIGLVIMGQQRFDNEVKKRLKSLNVEDKPVSAAPPPPPEPISSPEPPKPQRGESFLTRIKRFFDDSEEIQ
jgi:hypothetical protein